MENEKLFGITERGYNCRQVDEYLNALKTEYKKLFDYAKSTEEALKATEQKAADFARECEKLREANFALEAEKEVLRRKAEAPREQPAAPVALQGATLRAGEYDVLVKSLSTMTLLSEEIVRENKALRERLALYEKQA